MAEPTRPAEAVSKEAGTAPAIRKAPATDNAATTGAHHQHKPPPPEPQWSDFFASPLFLIIVAIWVWVFFSARKHKQKEAKRKEELQSLKKGDKVVTVGGMHGTVVSLTEKTMTLKPDEKAPTTITFDRVALLRKLTPGNGKGDDRTS